MKEDLGGIFCFVLAISFIFLVCVSAVATITALRGRFQAGAKEADGWLLELVWINMPLCIIMALFFGWLYFQTGAGFAARKGGMPAADDHRPYLFSTVFFPEKKLQGAPGSRQDFFKYNLRYSFRQ